ncbi:MAG: hypothetical protein ABIT70_09720 [Sulfuriferula sp.]
MALTIAIIALALSIFNTYSSLRIRALEKRTAFMSELLEAQQLISEIDFVRSEIQRINIDEILELKEVQDEIIEILDRKIAIKKDLSGLWESLSKNSRISTAITEKSMPHIKKVISEEKHILNNAQTILKRLNSIMAKK